MRISDWSSDVCSSDLADRQHLGARRIRDDRGSAWRHRQHVIYRRAISPVGRWRQRADRGWGISNGSPCRDPLLAQTALPGIGTHRSMSDTQVASGLANSNARFQRVNIGVPAKAGMTSVYSGVRSEEHTSELQSLMRISYA